MRIRPLGLAIMLIGSVATGGCAYVRHRANDAKDIADVGVTFSKKPCISVYASGPFAQVASIGLGYVDGRFVGLGEGRLCFFSPHYEKSVGAGVWGMEWLSYYYSEKEIEAMPKEEADKASNLMQVGVLGMLAGYAGEGAPPPSREKYAVSCPHYAHAGFVGVVASPRYLQMLDFVLGWTTLDICGDDKARGPLRAGAPTTDEPTPDSAQGAALDSTPFQEIATRNAKTD